jgi:hypothetical protein
MDKVRKPNISECALIFEFIKILVNFLHVEVEENMSNSLGTILDTDR